MRSQVDAKEVSVHITPYYPVFLKRTPTCEPLKKAPSTDSIREKHQAIILEAINKGTLAYVMAKVEEKNLPLRLALIPLIESHYNESALSPKGAGGLWQLMPGTAKELGITSKDRFQLDAATGAALKHLEHLYREFGHWHLAICAYNCGSQRLKEALSESRLRQTPLKLPEETKAYLQQFLALERYFDLS